MNVIVLDATAFIGGFLPGSKDETCYTVSEVINEIKDENLKLGVILRIKDGKIKLVEPSKEIVREVEELSKKTGDISFLSTTDIKLISLALQLKRQGKNLKIMTDDYALQNLAHELGIDFTPLIEEGIKRVFEWANICRGCGKSFPTHFRGKCDVCGSDLKKIVRKRKDL
jgi:UPF0271 protein